MRLDDTFEIEEIVHGAGAALRLPLDGRGLVALGIAHLGVDGSRQQNRGWRGSKMAPGRPRQEGRGCWIDNEGRMN